MASKLSENIKRIVFAVVMCAASGTASAAGGYGGFQLPILSFDDDNFAESFDPKAIVIRGGRNIFSMLALEGRLMVGLNDSSAMLGGMEHTVELSSVASAFAMAHTSLGWRTKIYGLLGMSRVSMSEVDPTASLNTPRAEIAMSYGFGADFHMSENTAANIEYVSYYNDKASLSGLAIGLTFSFH